MVILSFIGIILALIIIIGGSMKGYSLKAPTVAGFLTVLEKEGLLKRIRKPDSPRQVNVYITEDGLKMQEKLNVVYDEIDEIGFQDFTLEEKEKCLGYLSRMAENMMSYLKKHPLD